MYYFKYQDLRFFCLLLKTYPEYLNIIFFLKEKDALLEWTKLIEELTGIKAKQGSTDNIVFAKNVVFTLQLYHNQDFLGKRANVVIIDDNFSAQTINQVFRPLCASNPIQLCYLCEDSAEYFKKMHKRVGEVCKND